MSKRSRRRNKYKNFTEEQVSRTATANTTYTGGGGGQGMIGINVPSYMSNVNPYNTGTLPQDIPVSDPRFRVSSIRPFEPEIVTRKTVWDYYRVAIGLPNPSKILQTLGQNIEAFDELLADGRVKACMNNRRAGLLGMEWTIDQGNAPSRYFKIIQKVFEKIDVYTLISELALAPFYGYNVSEVNWKIDGGLVLPESVISKAARWFLYDDSNSLRYKTKVQQVLGEALPPRKFLVTRYHPTYTNPYGETLAEACYWPVKFRHTIYQYAMQFLQKYGMPWLDITLNTDLQEERLKEVLDTIQNTYEDGIIAHPDNTKIAPIAIGDSKSIDSYTTMLDNVNKEIDLAILGNNLNIEIKGGSYAAAQTAGSIRQDIIDEDRRMVEETMNTLIEWIGWYNFPAGVETPKFRLFIIEPATKDKAEIDIMLSKMGVKFTKEYFQRTYQLNDEDFDLGDPIQEILTGMKGKVNEPSDRSTGVLDSATAEKTDAAGIESKDATSNIKTKKAIIQQ